MLFRSNGRPIILCDTELNTISGINSIAAVRNIPLATITPHHLNGPLGSQESGAPAVLSLLGDPPEGFRFHDGLILPRKYW